MPDEIYEIIALAARYWFLLLMILIAWRSYRWYTRDRKKYKRRLKLLPDAGYIGELVVVRGDDIVRKGTCIPVSREGVLGYLRNSDVCVPAGGVANRHLWYLYDDADGLRIEPFRGRHVIADGQELIGRRMLAYLSHGSTLEVGQAKMRLRMFSGFEYAGAEYNPTDEDGEADLPEELRDSAPSDPIRRMHEIAAWQTMQDEAEKEEAGWYEEEDAGEDEQEFYPPEMDEGDEEILPPMDEDDLRVYENQDDSPMFYPPVMDDEDEILPPMDEDGEAPKSLYVDDDEAEQINRVVWDRLFRGGKKR